LPDIQSYKAEVSKPFSPFLTLLSSIVQHKKIVLDDNDSKELEKYILIHNNNPKSIMEKERGRPRRTDLCEATHYCIYYVQAVSGIN
jgi:hypothetical protein